MTFLSLDWAWHIQRQIAIRKSRSQIRARTIPARPLSALSLSRLDRRA